MKHSFKGFYELSDTDLSKIWLSEDTIFVLDTNILLNLYLYSQETQDEFFKILSVLRSKVWIPFHVALEYQRRRLEVIKNEKSVFDDIDKKLQAIKKIVGSDFTEFNLKARNTGLFDKEESFRQDLFLLVDNFKEQVALADKSQPCVRTHDAIRVKLDDLLEGKVGKAPTKEWVAQVAKDGATRYETKIPPGYADTSKDKDPSKASFIFNEIKYERKFGDLIIWKQLLEHLKENNDIKNVIFITDDSKEDWWEILDSRGKKTIGARPELKSEIYQEAEIENFKMYHTNDFLAAAKEYCGISVDDKAIEEAEFLLHNWEIKSSIEKDFPSFDTHEAFYKVFLKSEAHKRKSSAKEIYLKNLGSSKKHRRDFDANEAYLEALNNSDDREREYRAEEAYLEALNNSDDHEREYRANEAYLEALNNSDDHEREYRANEAYLEALNNSDDHEREYRANEAYLEALNNSDDHERESRASEAYFKALNKRKKFRR